MAEELKALFAEYGLRIVVLGCYLNLATPDMEELQRTMEIYKAHLRFAPLLGAEVVGTETGNPNTAYALDENSHTEASLRLFMDRLAPLVRYAEAVSYTHLDVYKRQFATFAGAGATVPLTGFGHALYTGVKHAVEEIGIMGAFTGGLTSTSAGIAAAIFFGTLTALVFKPRSK